MASLMVCAVCFRPNIQCLDWVDANTNRYCGTLENLKDSDTWCEDCEENAGLTEIQVDDDIAKAVVEAREKEDGRYEGPLAKQ